MSSIEETNSIFQQPWWLDAVAPGQWDEVIVQKNNRIVARMPYVMKKKYGLTLLTMPSLTQTLGPWLEQSNAKYTKQLSRQKELMQELIDRLPYFDYFKQNFSPFITNWLPFYWNGFNQTTRYTYRIEDLSDLSVIWSEFRENIRREIRKAEKNLKIRDDLDIDTFIEVNALTYERQGGELPYNSTLVHSIDKACVEREARKMLFAEDLQGKVHAAIYIIYDEKSAYYLMGGADPNLRTSGATSLLMWEAIKYASSVTKSFDFEGSMIEPIERFFRSFGAKQVPYHQVYKMNKRLKVLNAFRDLVTLFSRRN